MMRLRLGMVGGGEGAFIGGVHRIAARLDDAWVLTAGALSSDPERARSSAASFGIAPERAYADFNDMARAEAARPDGIDAVAVVTPNHLHAAPAIAFMNAGIAVICDKPLAATPAEAEAIAAARADAGVPFVLTHTYTGYPMVRQAREMARRGDLGDIRVVQAEYAQDWLAVDVRNKQADWRTDPARAGDGGCIGDIGTHAFNLAEFVCGMKVRAVAADLDAFVPDRRLDDNANVMLRFENGAKGMLWASQVAVGHENGLRLRVYGTEGGLAWCQETPNTLQFTPRGEPTRLLTRGGAGDAGSPAGDIRVPAGHPEGYIEAFATIYRDAAELIHAWKEGRGAEYEHDIPGIAEGVDGMRFIAACVASSANDAAWRDLTRGMPT